MEGGREGGRRESEKEGESGVPPPQVGGLFLKKTYVMVTKTLANWSLNEEVGATGRVALLVKMGVW